MAYSSVFKRVEKKYRVSVAQRRGVEEAARREGLMAPDAYGRTRITSLYLDTPERAMIARSVEKPLYKEKLRLRTYGAADGVALMAAFGAGPLWRGSGRAPLSDGEVEARVQAGYAAARDGVAAEALAVAVAVPAVAAGSAVATATADAAPSAAAGGPSAAARGTMAGDPSAVTVFFGIKKKFKGIVYKRRLALTLPAALAFVSGLSYEQACQRWPLHDADQAAALAPATRQIARELAAAMDRWLPLAPSMGIACDREAWALCESAPTGGPAALGGVAPLNSSDAPDAAALFDPELRLTFDDHLAYLDCFHNRAAWEPLIAPRESVLEIKSAGPYPPWLVCALSANAVYPTSFTKYGNAYQRCEGTALQRACAVG